VGPPEGWKDRRRQTERRLPEILESVVSESEWQTYFCRPEKAAPPLAALPGGENAESPAE